eukprot:CAMPEP_0174698328 /NCGR_PEP_ID=MMETSP1094-20130205/3950_1 /TAXON_ID=156173 /ORGANISM="Chrysochromulina brevifilum, Strain UTEX LB 985" /LENGTH=59 /DNA_ID=CAMNT_0015895479 /DNA_START=100 /DNA_END=279 /DNA_ORIENTATION=+
MHEAGGPARQPKGPEEDVDEGREVQEREEGREVARGEAHDSFGDVCCSYAPMVVEVCSP